MAIHKANHSGALRRPASPVEAAFTLVELLVVIGIIAVLIAILLPAISRARAQAQTTQCLAQMREIGNAALMWLSEAKYKQTIGTAQGVPSKDQYVYFYGTAPLNPGGPAPTEFGFLYPYLKTSKVYECPTIAYLDLPPSDPGGVKISYGTNPYDILTAFVKRKRPAETLMLGDYINVDPTTGVLNRGSGFPIIRSPDANLATGVMPNFHGRHNGGKGNVLWYDGHASSMDVYIVPTISLGRPRGYPSNYSAAAMSTCIKQKIGHLTRIPTNTPFIKFTNASKEEAEYYFLGTSH
jgi:prepilin-type processing-associated H-X9-DG protein/prepilin-type N-terminal cleavage/methylation domain-containing protein